MLIRFLIWISLAHPFFAHATPAYYPEEFQKLLQSASIGTPELKLTTHQVLSQIHVSRAGRPDLVVSRCPSDASAPSDASLTPDCYRHISLGYNRARRILMGRLHLLRRGTSYAIKCAYCEDELTEADFPRGRGPGPDKIPDVRVLNTEHTWPQSRFSKRFPTEMQKSDLHILFPVRSDVNSLRNNNYFGDVVSRLHSLCPKSVLGLTSWNTNEQYFEPPQRHKGNVARAIFYFSTRYKLKISEQEEYYLRRWHSQDPVDTEERNRNEEIVKVQFSRNPYIDFPELVDRITDF